MILRHKGFLRITFPLLLDVIDLEDLRDPLTFDHAAPKIL